MADEAQNPLQTLHAFVSGRVQGVSFRYYTQQKALELSLVGWVRNLRDGRVEAKAVGSPAGLKVFEDYLKVGPPAASVSELSVTIEDSTDYFESFSIRYDSNGV